MFISAASTISHQPTFRNSGFSNHLADPSGELITPDYSQFIPPMERRRMTQVQKMSMACSMDCLEQAGVQQPDAIIVGTSMGCSVNIKNFLDKVYEANGGLLSPTSFIVSTHNTVAGQIALSLKNHGYNMTHTQNSLSFEHSLIDGMLGIGDGFNHVLVGAADETEESLYSIGERLKNKQLCVTAGASFFVLSANVTTPRAVRLIDVASIGLIDSTGGSIHQFLVTNGISPADPDLVLFATNRKEDKKELEQIFEPERLVDYQAFSGTYFINSAFALHYGLDILLDGEGAGRDQISTILICNNLIPGNLGLILLSKNV